MLRKKSILCLLFAAALLWGCTKLHEKFGGDLTQGQVAADTANRAALLAGIYNSLESPFTSELDIFPLSEFSTDEAIFPTRATDWDDNGVWRALHQHKWAANNERIRVCFNSLNGISYAATDFLRYHPEPQQEAEARFIRAWVMYWLLDLFNQVPYREPAESVIQPAKVRTDTAALNFIINEINTVEADLPDGPAGKANKYAAKTLLMKCYLNKAVYENRSDPVFEAADMNQVIHLADEIINSPQFSFSEKYFDNFAPDNTNIGKENIFTQFNEANATPNNLVWITWAIVLHYNQVPFGAAFNGGATLSDFYDKFEPTDKRRGMVYTTAGSPPNPGNRINIGFLIGQQHNLYTDDSLKERFPSKNYLVFTREVKNIELGSNLESTGIRPLKYFLDYPNYFSPNNDYVYFRLSDVLLMKAEAILRGGTPTNTGVYGSTAKEIVNSIRTHPSRGATALHSIDRDALLDERGRELWWEGWRRQDLIRFGKFLEPFQEKDYPSDQKCLLFPIPADQISVNPNLVQNPGY